MIAKVISSSDSFYDIVRALTGAADIRRPRGFEFDDRVDYVISDGLTQTFLQAQNVASPRSAAMEMEAVASRCALLRKSPAYRFVLSWPTGEHPTLGQAYAAGQHALAALGMTEHQYLMAFKPCEPNFWTDVLVNRVNPQTFRVVSPFHDYLMLDRAMREIEIAQGWSHDAGRHIATPDGVKMVFKKQTHGDGIAEPATISSEARDVEAAIGRRGFVRLVHDAAPSLGVALSRESCTLQDVLDVLADWNLELQVKGEGLVAVHRSNCRLIAKASHIAHFMSRDRLEHRFGPLGDRLPEFTIPKQQQLKRAQLAIILETKKRFLVELIDVGLYPPVARWLATFRAQTERAELKTK